MSLVTLAGKQILKNLKTLKGKKLKKEKSNLKKVASTISGLHQLSCLSSESPLETAFTGSPIGAIRYLFEPINIEKDVIDSIEHGFNPDDFATRDEFVKKLIQHYIFYRNNHDGDELHNCLKDGTIEDFAKLLKKIPKEFIPDLMRVKNADGKTLLDAISLILHDDLSGCDEKSEYDIIDNKNIEKFKKHLDIIPKEFIPDVMRVKNADGQTLLDIGIKNTLTVFDKGHWNKVVEEILEKTPVESLTLSNYRKAGKGCSKDLGKKILKKMLSEAPKELREAVSSLVKCLKREDLTVDQFKEKLSKIPKKTFSLTTPGGYSLLHFILTKGQLDGGAFKTT